ncbi:uncharacterized protein LOC118463916 isoform X2 [Anopheles albimanus]|uniref:uncharacterized protein LOC118463916 isoform X2 n=1 Tax=Anopheles albimanus TaxID=7167 RepID=UPI00164212F7|nr:uncharacterized protein LOC118463916 isoform X2 [Anopheles albimanus]
MEREETIQDLHKMVERKLKLVQSQGTKLCKTSQRKLNLLNSLFVKSKRLKWDTLNQARDEIRKLASEIDFANDLEEKRASSSSNKITKRRQSTNLRVVLTRISIEDLPISKRTRSKSIDVRPEWAVSYTSDTETDKDIENDRPGVKQAVKRRNSKSATEQQQTHCTPEVTSTTTSLESKKRKGTDKKIKKSVLVRKSESRSVNQKKKCKRNVLYDSDTEDHVPEVSRLPCKRAESKAIINIYPDIPNDNSDIHCQSNFIMKCCLCPYRGVNMVEHYVCKHPQREVFVSRISPHQSKMIRKCPIPKHTSQTAVPAAKAVHRFCHFCEKDQHLTVQEWIKHVAEHTGEYEFNGTEKKPHQGIFFRNNHVFAYLCERCNYVQTRLSSMEHHLEKQHPSKNNDALKNIEYIRFSVVEKRIALRKRSNANSLITSNARIGIRKEAIIWTNQPMKPNTREDGYDSSCSTDTLSMIVSDDETTTISLKSDKSPRVEHAVLANDEVPVCLESIDKRREHSDVSASINPIVSTVASVSSVPVTPIVPIMPIVRSGKKPNIKKSIMPVEVTDEELLCRAHNKCSEQQQINAIPGNQCREKQYVDSRPISVVISERVMNYKDNMYGVSNETVIPSVDEQVNTDMNVNRLADMDRYWSEREVNGIPKPWILGSSQKMALFYGSMMKTESLVAFYKCMDHACDFSTQNDKAMEQHLLYHDFSKSYKSEIMQWLECCYCAFFANNPKELVEHLQSVHGDCGYQCNRCFYRSREASALAVHQSLFHSDAEEQRNRILQCTKRVKNYNSSDQGLIIRNMVKTVPLLVCNACPSGKFYGLLSFKDHIESHTFDFTTCNFCREFCGKMEFINHLQSIHGIYLFQCVYCQFGTYNSSWIEQHVSVHHPESIFCYHVRNASQTLEPYVRPRKVIPPHRFVVFSSA